VGARVGPHAVQPARPRRVGAFRGDPVHREVGLAAEQVVIDARRMRDRGVDLSRFPLRSGQAVIPHGVSLHQLIFPDIRTVRIN